MRSGELHEVKFKIHRRYRSLNTRKLPDTTAATSVKLILNFATRDT